MIRTCKSHTSMHESMRNGDRVGAGMCFVGMGWGWKKIHGDGAGMGLIFASVTLFTSDILAML